MNDPRPRRGPLTTIKGWMISIAVIGVAIGTMILSPFVFIAVVFVLLEAVAIARFRESRRRKPMSGFAEVMWILAFIVVIPIVSVVTALTALYIYCSINPDALQ